MTALISAKADALSGEVRVPGDKSISHRALILAASAVGESTIEGLLESDDVLATAAALGAFGAYLEKDGGDGSLWRVSGRGVGGLAEPDAVLDLGNSGTGARLLLGLAATHPFTTFMSGDASLRGRPMDRVMGPLSRMGARFTARSGGRLPLAVEGTWTPLPVVERLAVASAQVKSAILLAGLNAPGETTVIEPLATRDHTENLLRQFGARVAIEEVENGAIAVTLSGQPELSGTRVTVPGDFSAAAFPLVAALLVPGSRLQFHGLGVNPLRTGLVQTLREMGAEISVHNQRADGGEAIADLSVMAGPLKGTTVPPERVPSMIDEFPILAIAAACADGPTRFTGIGELKVKESDRVTAIAQGLDACGVRVEEESDSLTIHGTGHPPAGGARVASRLDHRMAMSFAILGMVSQAPVRIDDAAPITTSFPGFVKLMNQLGARLTSSGTEP